MDYPSGTFGVISAILVLSPSIYFALCHPVTLTFDLIFICVRDTVMDYLYAKFGDFSFSCFGFIVRTDRQNHTQTPRKNTLLATVVGVRN